MADNRLIHKIHDAGRISLTDANNANYVKAKSAFMQADFGSTGTSRVADFVSRKRVGPPYSIVVLFASTCHSICNLGEAIVARRRARGNRRRAGGQDVIVEGHNFKETSQVYFDGQPVPTQFQDTEHLKITTIDHIEGNVAVTVDNNDGSQPAGSSNPYEYRRRPPPPPNPDIVSLNPYFEYVD